MSNYGYYWDAEEYRVLQTSEEGDFEFRNYVNEKEEVWVPSLAFAEEEDAEQAFLRIATNEIRNYIEKSRNEELRVLELLKIYAEEDKGALSLEKELKTLQGRIVLWAYTCAKRGMKWQDMSEWGVRECCLSSVYELTTPRSEEVEKNVGVFVSQDAVLIRLLELRNEPGSEKECELLIEKLQYTVL